MANMKIIKGARRELEYQLLAALFTPGGDVTAEALKQQLAPRGKGRLRAVRTPRLHGAAPTPPPIEDAT